MSEEPEMAGMTTVGVPKGYAWLRVRKWLPLAVCIEILQAIEEDRVKRTAADYKEDQRRAAPPAPPHGQPAT